MFIKLATVLSLFCGVDYVGEKEKLCIKQTKTCINDSLKNATALNMKDKQVLEEKIVFKCFHAGAVKKK